MPSPASPFPAVHHDAPDSVAPVSLVHLLAARVADAADRPALVDALADPAGEVCRWGDLAAAALACRDGFLAAGLTRGDRIAHVGPHTPDWIVVDLACLLGGFIHAALHADMAERERRRIIGWIEPAAVVESGSADGIRLRRGDSRSPGAAGTIVAAGLGKLGRTPAAARDGDPRPVPDPAWRSVARELDACAAAVDPDGCCTILLSSGTTGLPRGVLHSQRALAANAVAVAEMFLDDPRDVRLSWLPMSHAVARTGDLYTALVRGGCLAVVRDRLRALEAARRWQPTVVLGVPAFFERLEQAARAGRIEPLAPALGGRVRVCVSGAAPLRRRTADFFAAHGVPLVEGYGLAEAGPVVAVSNPRIQRPGTVGPPLPGIEVRLDRRHGREGQLLVRTPSRSLGILDPGSGTSTMETVPISEDGWLETGDVAEIDEAGHLRITGRLRDTLVLANGLKLPPAEVERVLAEDEAVAQVCVVGDGLPWPVAVVVPEPAAIRRTLRRLRAVVFSRRAALTHPRVLAWLARRIRRRQAGLPRTWRVRRVVLLDRPFDAARGEVTESLKLRRSVIARHMATQIAAAAGDPPPRGVCVVTADETTATLPAAARRATDGDWLASLVWRGAGDEGFAQAAAAGTAPLRDRVAAVIEGSLEQLARLRSAGTLYEPADRSGCRPPPLADAPPPRPGRFSKTAEEALAEAGLWGLFVPEAFGGAGAGLGELTRAITILAADCPTAAGMLAVHSSIGAVSALAAFGTPAQQARHLPALAAGRPLSIFGGTEPDVGCDLGAVAATLTRTDAGLRLSGTKMFITGATHGRLVKLLATLDGRPEVVLARLPDADTATFRLHGYDLHPLRHTHNAALVFDGFPIDVDDHLAADGDRGGMAIVWHGLNRGRVTLAAQAAGTLRLLLAHAAAHAVRRRTWGQPIATRQLVQGRLARIAAGIAACDAVSAWAAAAIDAGGTGELEAIVAKTVASGCVRDAAFDALGVHGGRAFLVGHPLGDSLHDHLAVSIYEGESDLLGLALFRGIAKRHPALGGRGQPADGGAWRRAGAWLAWRVAALAATPNRDHGLLDRQLRAHAREARLRLHRRAVRIDRAIRRHGRALAERQLEIGALAGEVRDLAAVLATAWHADATGCDRRVAAADVWCRMILARVGARRLTPADHAACAALGSAVALHPRFDEGSGQPVAGRPEKDRPTA